MSVTNPEANQDVFTKVQLLGVENDRLNQVLSEVNMENSRLRSMLEKAAGQELAEQLLEMGRVNQKLAAEIVEKNLEIEDLRSTTAEARESAVVEKLKADIALANEEFANLESNLKLVVKENERINLVLKEKYNECEMLRKQVGKPQENTEDKQRIKLLLSEIERLNLALNEAQNENNILRRSRTATPMNRSRFGDTGTLEVRITEELPMETIAFKPQNYSQDLKQSSIISPVERAKKSGFEEREAPQRGERDENPEIMNKGDFLQKECDKLARALSDKNKETEHLKKVNEELKKELEAISKDNETLKASLGQVESVYDKMNALEQQCKGLIEENNALKQNPLAKSNDQHSSQGTESASINDLKAENEKLKNTLIAADTEVVRLRSVIAQLEEAGAHNNKFSQGASENLTSSTQPANYIEDRQSKQTIEEFNKRIGELIQENENLKTKLIEIRTGYRHLEDSQIKAQTLADENERLNHVISALQKELDGANKIAEQIPKFAEENQKLQKLLQEAGKGYQNLKTLSIKSNNTNNAISSRPEFEKKLKVIETEKANLEKALDIVKKENINLKEQINSLRLNSKGASFLGGGDNIKLEQENKELKNQVRQLTEEAKSLKDMLSHWEREARESLNAKGRVHSLLKENEELHHELNQIQSERQYLTQRLEAMQNQGSPENFESTNNTAESKLQKFKETIEILQGEIDRLNGMLQKKNNDQLKEKRAGLVEEHQYEPGSDAEKLVLLLQEKDQELADLRQQQNDIEDLVSRLRELEEINSKLAQDNRILFSDLQNMQSELEIRDTLISNLQQSQQSSLGGNPNIQTLQGSPEQQNLMVQQEIKLLEARNMKLVADNKLLLDSLNTRIQEANTLQNQLHSMIINQSGDSELEGKLQKFNDEIERLTLLVQAKSKEVEEWKRKYESLELTRAQQIEDLRLNFENYKKSNLTGSEFQVRYNAEKTAYETQISQLQGVIQTQEDELKHLKANLKLVSNENGQLIAELEELKRKLVTDGDDALRHENAELKAQIDLFKSNNLDVKQLAIRYSADRATDQSQIKQLKQMNNNYREELEKVYELVNQRKIEYDRLFKEHELLQKELSKQNQMKNSQTEEYFRSDRTRIESLQKQIAELTTAKEEYKKQAERNSLELTKKNKELIEKIQELDNLKSKYEDAFNNYQHLNNQLFQKLMAQNDR